MRWPISNNLHHHWACIAALQYGPGAFPVGCLTGEEFDGLVADSESFLSVYAHECVVVRGVVEEFAG